MIFYPPNKFDQNEWTIIILVIFNILVFNLVPKRFPKEVTPLIVLLSISFPKIMDHSMAVPPFDLYNLTDSGKYEIFDLAIYGIYPAFGYIFLYFIDLYQLKHFKLALYIIAWSILAVGFDFLLAKLHVFVYTGWNLIYSLPLYIVVLTLTFLFFKFIIHYARTKSMGY